MKALNLLDLKHMKRLRLTYWIRRNRKKGGDLMNKIQAEKQLEQIKQRLKKAYSLPKEEQAKWQKQIRELEQQAAKLQSLLGVFDEDKALELLIKINKEIAIATAERRYGHNDDFKKFLKDNPQLDEKWETAMDSVNKAYKLKDWSYYETCIAKYRETFLEIDKLYAQTMTTGFRELTEEEAKQLNIENVFGLR